MGAGSDERAECVCAREPEGQAPVGVHQSVVITQGYGGWVGGRKRKCSGGRDRVKGRLRARGCEDGGRDNRRKRWLLEY